MPDVSTFLASSAVRLHGSVVEFVTWSGSPVTVMVTVVVNVQQYFADSALVDFLQETNRRDSNANVINFLINEYVFIKILFNGFYYGFYFNDLLVDIDPL